MATNGLQRPKGDSMTAGIKIGYNFKNKGVYSDFKKSCDDLTQTDLFNVRVEFKGNNTAYLSYRMLQDKSDNQEDIQELIRLNMILHTYSRFEVSHDGV